MNKYKQKAVFCQYCGSEPSYDKILIHNDMTIKYQGWILWKNKKSRASSNNENRSYQK